MLRRLLCSFHSPLPRLLMWAGGTRTTAPMCLTLVGSDPSGVDTHGPKSTAYGQSSYNGTTLVFFEPGSVPIFLFSCQYSKHIEVIEVGTSQSIRLLYYTTPLPEMQRRGVFSGGRLPASTLNGSKAVTTSESSTS